MMICPKCKDVKTIRVRVDEGTCGPQWADVPCPQCNGTGEVPNNEVVTEGTLESIDAITQETMYLKLSGVADRFLCPSDASLEWEKPAGQPALTREKLKQLITDAIVTVRLTQLRDRYMAVMRIVIVSVNAKPPTITTEQVEGVVGAIYLLSGEGSTLPTAAEVAVVMREADWNVIQSPNRE